MEALLFLHSIQYEQVHYDREKGKKSQKNSQQGAVDAIMEGQGLIVPQ